MIRSALRHSRKRWFSWVSRRITPNKEVCLDQRKIFIFPTRYGFFYLLTASLLFIGGINYENSLILNLCFLLVSLFIVAILHTFHNLSGLIIKAGKASDAFSGQSAAFTIALEAQPGRSFEDIKILWYGRASTVYSVNDGHSAPVTIDLDTPKRGVFIPKRLCVETVFPLGLLRAWSWVDLNMKAIVYPNPQQNSLLSLSSGGDDHSGQEIAPGEEDFDQLKAYAPGDSLKKIAWKQYAQGRGLLSKHFHGYNSGTQWLTWESVGARDVEERLSKLCYWVLKYSDERKTFGLQLPHKTFEPSAGPEHRLRCLQALATYGLKQ